jgi:hypothetical protein
VCVCVCVCVCVLRGLCGVLIKRFILVQVISDPLKLQLEGGGGGGRLKVTCRIFSEYGYSATSCLIRRLTPVIPKIHCDSVSSFLYCTVFNKPEVKFVHISNPADIV